MRNQWIVGFLFILAIAAIPLSGYGADLSVGNTISGNGDMILNGDITLNGTGKMTATSFMGDGSGLTNIDAANINGAIQATIPDASITSNKLAVGAIKPNHIAFYSGHVAVVATSGGDYTTPEAAMEDYVTWCPGERIATNPCLLKIMPGVYTLYGSVSMQPYIDIEGSGENLTKITLAIGGYTIVTNGNSEVRFLTVESSTGYGAIKNAAGSTSIQHTTILASNNSVGILNSSGGKIVMRDVAIDVVCTVSCAGIQNGYTLSLTNVNVNTLGAGDSVGIFGFDMKLDNVTVNASGGGSITGIQASGASATITNVKVNSTTTGASSYGIKSYGELVNMTNVTATASGGAYGSGIDVYNGSSAIMKNVVISGIGTTSGIGVRNANSNSVKIYNSLLSGSTHALQNDAGPTYIVNTQLDGGAFKDYGTVSCLGAFDANFIALNANCQ